jgi:acetyl-CoA acetyltransferase
MTERSIRGRAAVVGVGESDYYRRGRSPDPEFVLCLKAILAACREASVDPKDIDGFVSYADDRNNSVRLASALGIKEMRWSTMQWGGGGGGGSGAIQQAAAAIACGFAECIVVFRALAQGEFGRFGGAGNINTASGNRAFSAPYGLLSPAQMFAAKVIRFFEETGVTPDTQKAVALASYHHAQQNPRAVMHGRPLTGEDYDVSRWIVEPFRLFDCCQENDAAAALILMSAERASDFCTNPAYVVSAAQGGAFRSDASVHNAPDYATANFKTLAPRLYDMAGLTPADVDVVQAYENFTGGTVMALLEHGFCTPETADKVISFDNLVAPDGKLPLNTSGGNLAECYTHGLELQVEGVRQLRGQSSNQVPGAKVSLVVSGPMVIPASDVLFGTEETVA